MHGGTQGHAVASPAPIAPGIAMPSFPVPVVMAAIALLLGVLAGHWVRRREGRGPGAGAGDAPVAASSRSTTGQKTSLASPVLDIVLAGVAAARLAFVVQWWPQYAEEPWSILRLGDGGYTWWAALPAAALMGGWVWRRTPALRGPLLVSLAVAAFGFALMMGVRHVLTAPGAPLPALTLRTVEGDAAPLEAYRGQPVVLNLWATWCGPCRREMPALARAQQRHPQVHFVFANQGESPAEVQAFLQQSRLRLDNSLLDGSSQLSMALTARALPTTAFYDAQGAQVRVHVGELSDAAIEQQLQAMGAVVSAGTSAPARHPQR